MELAWHYTTNDADRGHKIFAERIVQPTKGASLDELDKAVAAGIPRRLYMKAIEIDQKTKRAVWFSLEQFWEPSANKLGLGSSLQDLCKIVEVIRIGVNAEVCPLTWDDYCRDSGHDAKHLRSMKSAAYSCNSRPSTYRLTWEAVPAEQWVAVERLDGDKWVPLR